MNAVTPFGRASNRLAARETTVVVVDAADRSAAPSARPGRRAFRAALFALALLGCGLRAAALLSDRCLWIDEAMLALNLLGRTPAQLLEPLDWNQGAPVGFLLLSKLAVAAFGSEEWALRLVPFYGSLLGVVGFAWLAPRLLPRPAALLAVGLFAVSPALVSYAGECKQYETDATVAVALLAAATGLLHDRRGAGRWVVLAAAGAGAVWLSHPATFVLGGIGTALLARAAWDRDRARAGAACGTVAAWLLSFACCYLVSLRHLGSNKYLLDYWAGHFLPFPPKSLGDLAWVVDHLFAFFRTPGGFDGKAVAAGGLAAALAGTGLWHLAGRRWAVAAALALPAAFVLLASGLHRYPLGGRLLLFLVPTALLLVAAGAGVLLESGGRLAAVPLLGVLLAGPALETADQLRSPPRAEQVGPVLAAVRGKWQPGDRLYVYYGAEPAFRYYARTATFPAASVIFGGEHRGEPAKYREELAALPREGRLWTLFAHRHGTEEPVMRAYLDFGGRRCAESVVRPGAAAYLYDPAEAAAPVGPVE